MNHSQARRPSRKAKSKVQSLKSKRSPKSKVRGRKSEVEEVSFEFVLESARRGLATKVGLARLASGLDNCRAKLDATEKLLASEHKAVETMREVLEQYQRMVTGLVSETAEQFRERMAIMRQNAHFARGESLKQVAINSAAHWELAADIVDRVLENVKPAGANSAATPLLVSGNENATVPTHQPRLKVHGGRYYHDGKQVSNFTVKIFLTKQGDGSVTRKIQFYPDRGVFHFRRYPLPAFALSSCSTFRAFCLARGNYKWSGEDKAFGDLVYDLNRATGEWTHPPESLEESR